MNTHPTLLLAAAAIFCLTVGAHAGDSREFGSARATYSEEFAESADAPLSPTLSLGREGIFNSADALGLIRSLPLIGMLEGRRFPLSGNLTSIGTTSVGPFASAFSSRPAVDEFRPPLSRDRDDMGIAKLDRLYSSGEVGAFYGKSSGKFGREEYGAYIIGGVGNDKFHVTVGAAYEESTQRIPRGWRPQF